MTWVDGGKLKKKKKKKSHARDPKFETTPSPSWTRRCDNHCV